MTEAPRFNFIDVFSGIGGLTLGFRDSSQETGCEFVPRLMVDSDGEAREVANRNMPEVPFLVADVHKLSANELRRAAGLAPKEPVHVLVGGPPCQGFSWLGKRALDDARNVHLVDFLRLVRELRPLVAVMENVPLVVTSHGGAIINEIVDGFGALGYASCADIVTASDYGVPQLRKRAFVLGYRGDLQLTPQFPRRTHERIPQAIQLSLADKRLRFESDKLPYVSVEEAIGDLPALNAGEGDEFMFYQSPPHSDYQRWARTRSVGIFNHKSRAHTQKYLEKISVIEEGGRNQELPADQRFSDNYFSQAYARLHRGGIAQTMTTYFGNPGSGRFMHYRDLRSITVREAARFQSFPDTFVFDGHQGTQMRHVGNAVPPLLARALRDQIGRDLLSIASARVDGHPNIAPSLGPTVAQTAKELRSRIMRAVPAKNTSVELTLRRLLWAAGVRGYRLHDDRVPGHPDVVFASARVAVFVDGCFWHGCDKCYREPKSNGKYWQMKARRNRDRDARVNAECEEEGWRVVRVWEHEIKDAPRLVTRRVVTAVRRGLKGSPKTRQQFATSRRHRSRQGSSSKLVEASEKRTVRRSG